jgi:UDP-4-amino-4,6-dideoxy-N-acetyl-beta-L-altrosamine transaminase
LTEQAAIDQPASASAPALADIPYGTQNISEADIAAVVKVLRSSFLTQGPAVPAFEDGVARFCGAAHAIAVANATAALHIACLALDVGPGDLVWTSPVSFVASSNCALYCGADVDFVDIDPATFNMSVAALEEKLAQAERAGRLPKLVIPVHLGGLSCDMAAIRSLADRYGFRIIEDASHAIGGEYRQAKVGSCPFSDIAIFSFHPVKVMTTGEGGMALTNDPALAERMRLLRSHGITRDPALMEQESEGGWYYEQLLLGFNYRLTDIQAALGSSQLERVEAFVARRQEIAAHYDAAFADAPLAVQRQSPEARSSYHLYVIRYPGADADTRRAAYDSLRAAGIGVNLHYHPIYLQPYYRRLGFQPGHCLEAEAYNREAITIPLFPAMTDAQVDRVVAAVMATC